MLINFLVSTNYTLLHVINVRNTIARISIESRKYPEGSGMEFFYHHMELRNPKWIIYTLYRYTQLLSKRSRLFNKGDDDKPVLRTYMTKICTIIQ